MTIEPLQWKPETEVVPNALLIKEGRLHEIALPLGADDGASDIHQLIGNFFTSCFSVPDGRGGTLTGYCDDEFLLKTPEELDRNWNVLLEKGTLHADFYPIGGSIVVVGTTRSGESRALSAQEMGRFFVDEKRFARMGERLIPVLGYRRD